MRFEKVTLAQISSLITKGTTPTTLGHAFSNHGVPFLRAQNLQSGRVEIGGPDQLFVSPEVHRQLKRSAIKPEDLLVAIAGTIGRVALVESTAPEMNCNQAVAIVRLKNNAIPAYFLHWLQSDDAQRQMHGAGVTGTITNLSLTELGNLIAPLPSKEDQLRIAALLDRADEVRVRRQITLSSLQTLKTSSYVQFFGDPLGNPKKWPIVPLGELTSYVSSGITPLGGSTVYTNDGVLFIRSQNVLMGELDLSDAAYITPAMHDAMRRTWVKNGDVLLNITGASIGRVAIYEGEDDNANVNQHVCIIRLDRQRTVPEYIAATLGHPSFNRHLVKQNAGATRQAFNFEQIRRFDVPLPPVELQSRFATALHQVEEVRRQTTQSSAKINELFLSLRQGVFRGEL